MKKSDKFHDHGSDFMTTKRSTFRMTGLPTAPYKVHPQPLKDIPPRLIKYVAVGTLSILVDRNYELNISARLFGLYACRHA